MQQLLQWNTIHVTYYWCVFVVLDIQREMRLRHIEFCGLSGCNIVFHISLISGAILEKKPYLNMQSMFRFSPQILPETFLILGRNERDGSNMCVGLHVKYPLLLSDCNISCTRIFSTGFRKTLKYQISWKSF